MRQLLLCLCQRVQQARESFVALDEAEVTEQHIVAFHIPGSADLSTAFGRHGLNGNVRAGRDDRDGRLLPEPCEALPFAPRRHDERIGRANEMERGELAQRMGDAELVQRDDERRAVALAPPNMRKKRRREAMPVALARILHVNEVGLRGGNIRCQTFNVVPGPIISRPHADVNVLLPQRVAEPLRIVTDATGQTARSSAFRRSQGRIGARHHRHSHGTRTSHRGRSTLSSSTSPRTPMRYRSPGCAV